MHTREKTPEEQEVMIGIIKKIWDFVDNGDYDQFSFALSAFYDPFGLENYGFIKKGKKYKYKVSDFNKDLATLGYNFQVSSAQTGANSGSLHIKTLKEPKTILRSFIKTNKGSIDNRNKNNTSNNEIKDQIQPKPVVLSKQQQERQELIDSKFYYLCNKGSENRSTDYNLGKYFCEYFNQKYDSELSNLNEYLHEQYGLKIKHLSKKYILIDSTTPTLQILANSRNRKMRNKNKQYQFEQISTIQNPNELNQQQALNKPQHAQEQLTFLPETNINHSSYPIQRQAYPVVQNQSYPGQQSYQEYDFAENNSQSFDYFSANNYNSLSSFADPSFVQLPFIPPDNTTNDQNYLSQYPQEFDFIPYDQYQSQDYYQDSFSIDNSQNIINNSEPQYPNKVYANEQKNWVRDEEPQTKKRKTQVEKSQVSLESIKPSKYYSYKLPVITHLNDTSTIQPPIVDASANFTCQPMHGTQTQINNCYPIPHIQSVPSQHQNYAYHQSYASQDQKAPDDEPDIFDLSSFYNLEGKYKYYREQKRQGYDPNINLVPTIQPAIFDASANFPYQPMHETQINNYYPIPHIQSAKSQHQNDAYNYQFQRAPVEPQHFVPIDTAQVVSNFSHESLPINSNPDQRTQTSFLRTLGMFHNQNQAGYDQNRDQQDQPDPYSQNWDQQDQPDPYSQNWDQQDQLDPYKNVVNKYLG